MINRQSCANFLIIIGLASIIAGVTLLIYRDINEIRKPQICAIDILNQYLDQFQEEPQKVPFEDIAKLIEAIKQLLLIESGPAAFLALFGLACFYIGSKT